MGLFRKRWGKKESAATKFAKQNKPKAVVSKSPIKLVTIPTYEETDLATLDDVLAPAIEITAAVASMSNQLVQLQENICAFGALTEGVPTFGKVEGVVESGQPTFAITSSTGSTIVTMGAETGVIVYKTKEWADITKTAKGKVGLKALAQNLADYLKYLAQIIDNHAQAANKTASISLDLDQPFPTYAGTASPRAPWVGKMVETTVETTVSSCMGLCSSTTIDTIRRELFLDELLRRKKASTSAGRKGMKKSAGRTIKELKKAEETANKLIKSEKKLKEGVRAARCSPCPAHTHALHRHVLLSSCETSSPS